MNIYSDIMCGNFIELKHQNNEFMSA